MARLSLASALLASLPMVACAPGDDIPGGDIGAARAEQRPDRPAPGALPPNFDAEDIVERYDSPGGRFRIHFARAGEHAVPEADEDESGVPDYVELSAAEYDASLAHYRDARSYLEPIPDDFLPHEHGGDDRIDVYLLDFGTSANGAFRREACLPEAPRRCTGYIVMDNDFAGSTYRPEIGVRTVASHELFHAVQAAYDSTAGAVLGEATAVWASEDYAPDLDEVARFSGGYLARPDRSLDQEPTGPVDAFTYGAALFVRFLVERHDAAIVRELYEALADDELETWLDPLEERLEARGERFEDAFRAFALALTLTGPRADPSRAWGDEGHLYRPVEANEVTLPLESDRLRVFYASTRFFTARTGGRDRIRAALVPEVAEDLDDLAIVLTVTGVGGVLEARILGALDGSDEVALPPQSERVVLGVVNTARRGSSRRPRLCLGDPAEVEACRLALEPPLDAGAPDAGLAADAGPMPPAMEGCACRAAAPPKGRHHAALLAAALLFGVAKRRRRPSRRR